MLSFEDQFIMQHKEKQIELFTLKNKNGIEVKLTNVGARIVSLITPDKNKVFRDIVLGYNTIEEYLTDNLYMGATIGQYANRIANGRFFISGTEYQLSKNNGVNTLHGGHCGFDKQLWDAFQEENSIKMTYCSEDMEEGFPGKLSVEITFSLTNSDELIIDYRAQTNKETIVNLTNHTYFNLKGDGDSTICDHLLYINADYITPVDLDLLPTGELMHVENTPFDFRTSKKVGADIEKNHPQLSHGKGYDHNWVLNKRTNAISLAASLVEPTSGRTMEVYTTKPGIQFFSCNFGDLKIHGKNGRYYIARSGLALEPQFFPDSPNQPDFPSSILKPNEKYQHKTVFKFFVK